MCRLLADPQHSAEVEGVARRIAGDSASLDPLVLARRVVEAHLTWCAWSCPNSRLVRSRRSLSPHEFVIRVFGDAIARQSVTIKHRPWWRAHFSEKFASH